MEEMEWTSSAKRWKGRLQRRWGIGGLNMEGKTPEEVGHWEELNMEGKTPEEVGHWEGLII